MYKIEGQLYPHREHWPRNNREFFHHMMPQNTDDDPYLVPVKWIKDWLDLAQITYTTEWEQKGRKVFVFTRRVDAVRFALAWL